MAALFKLAISSKREPQLSVVGEASINSPKRESEDHGLHPWASILRLALLAILIYWVSVALAGISSNVFASSGLVSTIGGATFVQGSGQFWVTSAKPTFSGVTTAGAAVTGTVGSQSVTATANASGNWSWTPATDLSGDNPVTITSGASTAAFTLTIGDVPESVASASASTLEPAGTVTNTIAIIGIGTLLISLGSFGLAKTFRKN